MKKDFTITKEQIITLNTDGNRDVRECLNKWFPDAFNFQLEKNGHFIYDGVTIFGKGKWAEIIPTKTRLEAEKELNCKIID
jgi:hypothetical protein